MIELKNPADENATVWTAFQQLQTYQAQIPALFATNAALVVSDGVQARIGSLGAGKEWFKPWRTISGREDAAADAARAAGGAGGRVREAPLPRPAAATSSSSRTAGGGKLVKKMAGYHQFHAVNVAVEETLRAAQAVAADRVAETPGRYEAGQQPGGEPGDRRVGVVWHTQGSGKSLTMAFYAGRVILHPAMENPTIVVLTDRNDLDDQLFGTFARCRDLLRQPPVQAADRADLRAKLAVASGGVVFTTIQKFFPEEKGDRHPVLSERRNIVVIADEAHRSQYDFIDGFARHMRDALPQRLVHRLHRHAHREDRRQHARRVRRLHQRLRHPAGRRGRRHGAHLLREPAGQAGAEGVRAAEDRPRVRGGTEGEEVERKEKLKSQVGAARSGGRLGEPHQARSPATWWSTSRTASRRMDGKAMVVCMSRRICVELYDEIVALRPAWHGEDDEQGALKVVMTGSASDPLDWQPHIRNKPRREALAQRFRDPNDPFKIVIVRDMWLTGFDAPSLHTMYVDKPMRGHGLMQAIARVNRVFKDKPGGLVVDYLGLADELKQALATYTESGGTGKTAHRPGRGRGGDAGEVRGLPRPVPRLRLVAVDHRARRRSGSRCCRRRRSTSSRRRTARTGCCAPSPSCRRPSRWRCRTRRRCASATTWASSRPCARCSPRARPASARPTRSWTTPSGRSSPRRWSPTRSWTSSPPPG